MCVNLKNYNTIEIRIFKATLKYSTFIATLQMVDEICNVALSFSEEELREFTWTDFAREISELSKPELVAYLKFRGLYVNELVEEDEEDQ